MADTHAQIHSTPTPAAKSEGLFDSTTLRGMATCSFCFGIWSSLTFWLYPFGFFFGILAVLLGMLTMGLGVRAGLHRENLAFWGVLMGMNACGLAFACYRGVQFFFEGSTPMMP